MDSCNPHIRNFLDKFLHTYGRIFIAVEFVKWTLPRILFAHRVLIKALFEKWSVLSGNDPRWTDLILRRWIVSLQHIRVDLIVDEGYLCKPIRICFIRFISFLNFHLLLSPWHTFLVPLLIKLYVFVQIQILDDGVNLGDAALVLIP